MTFLKRSDDGRYYISIPNKEVQSVFREEILEQYASFSQKDWAKELREALVSGEERLIKEKMESYIINTLSYYDYGLEKNYQCLILGVSAILFYDCCVKSEVNAGSGRCDILIKKKGDKGQTLIIELKSLKAPSSLSNLKRSAEAAVRQIERKDYFAELRKEGYKDAILLGFAFHKNKIEVAMNKAAF